MFDPAMFDMNIDPLVVGDMMTLGLAEKITEQDYNNRCVVLADAICEAFYGGFLDEGFVQHCLDELDLTWLDIPVESEGYLQFVGL